ncbi:MAG TPA: DUF996 domain-containing protein [Nitrososphaerales archaeon]|nr:DUF996 domain-containing protein [Nitrososphaerales archaeon]
MGRLSDAKIIGGIGSILEIIPFLSIVGYILVLISVKFVSDEVHDSSIFNDMIIAVVAGIVGVAAGGFVLIFSGIFAVFTAGVSAFLGILAVLAIVWIALIVSSIFVRRAYGNIAAKLNVSTFRTAGTLYFVGALLTIVIVGFLILFVAYLVQVIAFFSIQEGQPVAPAPAAMAAQGGAKYCPSCGAQVPTATAFCPNCGAKQP